MNLPLSSGQSKKASGSVEAQVEPLKRPATQELKESSMLVGMLEPYYAFLTRAITLGGLDPRDETFEQRGSPVKQLEEVRVDLEDPTKKVKIRKLLTAEQSNKLVTFLKAHKEDFAWTHQDMLGIDNSVNMHKLNMDPKAHLVKQKRHAFNLKRYATINEEVDKTKASRFIWEVYYP